MGENPLLLIIIQGPKCFYLLYPHPNCLTNPLSKESLSLFGALWNDMVSGRGFGHVGTPKFFISIYVEKLLIRKAISKEM